MEELRIKCPSCGIILDVRNSKNEAVKRIVCPNCKKQLAVTFHEEPQPAQFVEIKMVQLSDGSTKTILRALTDDHVVKVNGEQLQKDDEVVLSVGDELQIDNSVSIFGKEGVVNSKQAMKTEKRIPVQTLKPSQEPLPTPPPFPSTEPRNRYKWYLAALLVGFVIAFGFWYLSNRQQEPVSVQNTEVDTTKTVTQEQSKEKEQPQTKQVPKQKKEKEPVVEKQSGKPNKANLSNYELEKLAMSGDVEAQYLLGKRWVSRHDSINVVKGIKYLKLASQNGSSEARSTLRSVYSALQQSAANGSTTAGNILREQR